MESRTVMCKGPGVGSARLVGKVHNGRAEVWHPGAQSPMRPVALEAQPPALNYVLLSHFTSYPVCTPDRGAQVRPPL